MYKQLKKSKIINISSSINSATQKKRKNRKRNFGLMGHNLKGIAQRKLLAMRYSGDKKERMQQYDLPGDFNDGVTIQRQKIGNIDVYVDKGYPVWESENYSWHLTMKDTTRWHITKEDRSDSYWFEVDGGFKRGVNPKKDEYGRHRDKHHNLEDAPDKQYEFIRDNLLDIIKVTDQKP